MPFVVENQLLITLLLCGGMVLIALVAYWHRAVGEATGRIALLLALLGAGGVILVVWGAMNAINQDVAMPLFAAAVMGFVLFFVWALIPPLSTSK